MPDLPPFRRASRPLESGEIRFTLDARSLADAASLARLATPGGKSGSNAVRVVMDAERFTLSAFNPAAFVETHVTVAEFARTGPDHPDATVAALDLNTLRKVAATSSGPLGFHVTPATLTVRAGSREINLPVLPALSVADLTARIGSPAYLRAVPTLALRRTLGLAATFRSAPDEIYPHKAILELRDGMAFGGCDTGMTLLWPIGLETVQLKFRYEALAVLDKVLPRLDPDNTHLYETRPFYVLRDAQTSVGFERTELSFTDAPRLLRRQRVAGVQVLRDQLLDALRGLGAVSSDPELPVRLRTGERGTLRLEVRDPSGRVSSDAVAVSREDEETFDLSATAAALVRAAESLETARISLSRQPVGDILVVTEIDGPANTMMFLTTRHAG